MLSWRVARCGRAVLCWRRAIVARHQCASACTAAATVAGEGRVSVAARGNYASWRHLIVRHCSSRVWPAHHKVVLPALSPTMETGSIISWEKSEGDRVSEGDLLAEVETDKASMGFESSDEGFLAKILVPAGSKDIALGKLLCILVENKEDVAQFADYVDTDTASVETAPSVEVAAPPAASVSAPRAVETPPARPSSSPAPLTVGGASVMASPRARQAASQLGVDLTSVQPGSDNLVRFEHVQKSAAAAAATPAVTQQTTGSDSQQPQQHEDIEVTAMRRTIARRLLESKQTVPHYYLSMEVNMQAVTAARASINATADGSVKLSVNDFIVKAAALACMRVPEANSAWMGSFIRQYSSVDVCVAVSTPHGLITPIVFGAERRGLADISATVKELAARARERRLQPHEFQGGTFSVSNLGMFGVTQFSAIINPPQSCILAVGGSQQRSADGESVMVATLSCDHRVVDGAVGARWLAVFRDLLQQPLTMIL